MSACKTIGAEKSSRQLLGVTVHVLQSTPSQSLGLYCQWGIAVVPALTVTSMVALEYWYLAGRLLKISYIGC